MKKFVLSLGLIGILGGFLSFTSASTNCKEVNFSSSINACVNIKYVSTNRRNLETSIQGGITGNLICDIMLPDSSLRSISNCNGEYTYNGNNIGRIKLRIRYNNNAPTNREEKPNNNNERLYPQRAYDRGNRRRASDSTSPIIGNDNFLVTTSPIDPQINERANITIRARRGSTTNSLYRGTVRFKVERKSGTSWITAANTLYDISRTSYTFNARDNGNISLNNFIRFKNNNYEYRLVIYDETNSNIQGIKTFYVGSDNQYNYNTNNFLLNTNNHSPNAEQRINIGIRARDGTTTDTSYRGKVYFEVYYRATGSSTRVRTTSSTYYNIHTNYQNGYTFGTTQNGYININNFIKFNRSNYTYKLVVYDESNDNITGELLFTLGNIDSSPTYIAGFTVNEFNTLKDIYNTWDNRIENLKSTYPKLRTNTRWISASNTFKKDMKDVIDNKNIRKFKTYIAFSNTYITRQRYTNSVK